VPKITSWGKVCTVDSSIAYPATLDDIKIAKNKPNLAIGLRRSYGTSCLLDNGNLIDMNRLRNVISFDNKKGIFHAHAGISLAEILSIIIPAGWFLPVTPGTKFVTLGGAIANDVHGKNHHINGTFAKYVKSIELQRSDTPLTICTPTKNKQMFNATVGGLGLTGVIQSAKIQLIPIRSTNLITEDIKFYNIDDFLTLSEESNDWPYTVAWVDCMSQGHSLGQGIFSRGKFIEDDELEYVPPQQKLSIPFDVPNFVLNTATVKMFNYLYYRKQFDDIKERLQNYDSFFYPLDSIHSWNRLYGKNGFYQYQCVIPKKDAKDTLEELLDVISSSGQGSFLAVLKTFGSIKSSGLLSFPMEGVTLALDFKNSDGILDLFSKLDDIVVSAKGRLYPAKDGRIPPALFKKFYPKWEELEDCRDSNINSKFWQSVLSDEKN